MFTGNLLQGRWVCAIGVSVALSFLAFGSLAQAETIVIDDFSAPNPADELGSLDKSLLPQFVAKSPTFYEASGAMLGGERDLLLEVLGTLRWYSVVGSVGENGGILEVGTVGENSRPVVTLQYDGADAENVAVDGDLHLDAMAPPEDLTLGGNDALELGFNYLDAGDGNSVNLRLTVVGDNGTSASQDWEIAESPGTAFTFTIPYAPLGTNLFASVESLTFEFNNPLGGPTSNVDFALDYIMAVPEPSTLVLLGVGIFAFFAVGRRWRRR